jgi:putative transposase
MIDKDRDRFGVEPICRALDVSASAYYQRATGQRSTRDIDDERLLSVIGALHATNYYAYGYRRMHKALRRADETAGRDRVKRLMRRTQIVKAKRPSPRGARRPQIPQRRAARTWSTATTAAHPACQAAGLPAQACRPPRSVPSCTYTLLRGPVELGQYTRIDFNEILDDHGVRGSIGSVGDAYGNAMAESFVDSFKTEMIRDRAWKTRSQLELAIVEYVAWFNNSRLHDSLNDIPPAEFEALSAVQYV